MSQQRLNRQARLHRTDGLISNWMNYGSVSLLEAARIEAYRIARSRNLNWACPIAIGIEVRCETSPEIPLAVFQVKVELVATVLDPRGDTDK
jgi:hypothetical protein